MPRLRLIGVLLCLVASTAPLRAELILDDFDDPAQTVNPAMEGEYVATEGVGDLNATRKIRIATSQSELVGSLNANITTPSALTANIVSHVPDNDESRPRFSYQFNYEFPAVDISEGGRNNALFFDFLSIEGTEPPLYLQFGVWDDPQPVTIFLGRVSELPFTQSPFTAIFPFSDFTTRAGTPALPDFSTISRIEFSFVFLRPNPAIQWSAALDRIRIGAIPEPSTWELACLSLFMAVLAFRVRSALSMKVRPASGQFVSAVESQENSLRPTEPDARLSLGSSITFRRFFFAILILGGCLSIGGVAAARAELILDDFDDPAEVVSPQMFDEFVSTPHVGQLNATRSIRIAGARGNPDGRLDANISAPSMLTGQVSRLNPRPNSEARATIQSDYAFTPTDVTQGGRNNAIFFEFSRMTSELRPSLFQVLIFDGNEFLLSRMQNLTLSSAPFTLVLPFDAFTNRDGTPATPRFDRTQSINVELRVSTLSGGGPDPLNFSMAMDRIRIGRIPEPAAIRLGGAGGLLGLLRRRSPVSFRS